ncbi:MAG: hypothetical protein A2Y07_07605 [Planctomycetes bacterium GWF2_50_10]|nr:MAG: hypothetical protein A2Y07_07605 [Planctomycetes bacterium GWF2_50_10]
MFVGVATIQIHMTAISSLKEKRSIVKSLVERLKNRFNCSAAEVAHQDVKNSSIIGLAVVANDSTFVNQSLDTIINFAYNDERFFIVKATREVFPHSDY